MAETIAVVTSIIALLVSAATAWLTYFHKGRVRMAEPSMLAFGYDATASGFVPKVMVRCLLFSTGERGHVIEALFVSVRDETRKYVLPIWGMDEDNKLVRGGGILVGKTGIVAWHHFIAPDEDSDARFRPGTYHIDILARVHNKKRPLRLWSGRLELPPVAAFTAHNGTDQVWFDRQIESKGFEARRESRNNAPPLTLMRPSRSSHGLGNGN